MLFGVMMPATRKTQVREPLCDKQLRSEPSPESLRLVTSMTWPPRPPTDEAPPPCAPGNAGIAPLFAGADTAMVAVADLVLSASLLAVTLSVPALLGATYTPPALMVPLAADHVTDLSETLPDTLAEN